MFNFTDSLIQLNSIRTCAEGKMFKLAELKERLAAVVNDSAANELLSRYDMPVHTFKAFIEKCDTMVRNLEPVIEAKRAQRIAAKQAFKDSLKPGQKFKLETGIVVEFVDLSSGSFIECKVACDDSAYEMGEQYHVSITRMMNATRLSDTEYAVLVLDTATDEYHVNSENLTKEQAEEVKNVLEEKEYIVVICPTKTRLRSVSVEQHLEVLNESIKKTSAKVKCINQVRTACKALYAALTPWLVDNADEIKFKADGSLHKKYAKQVRAIIDQVVGEQNGYITTYARFEQGRSFNVLVRNHTNIGESSFNHNETVYISNSDLTVCKADQQSAFERITPITVIKLERKRRAIRERMNELRAEESRINNLVGAAL